MPLLPLLLVLPAQDITQTVVTAPRAGRTATAPGISEQVITAEELAATGERSLPRAISKASGLFVQETNLGGGAPIVRGLIGNQVLIVVDGVRLNDGTTRSGPNQSLNGIDPTNVERVEIIRGPNAVLYGSDALGGAILIWTRNRAPLSRDKEGTRAVQLEAGVDANTAAEGAREYGSLSVATEDVGVLVGGSFQDWQMLHSGKGEVQNTGYHGQSWYASSELQLAEKRSIRVSAMRTRDFDVPRSDRMNTGYGQTQPADAENYFTLQDRARYLVAYNDSALGFADQMQARLSLRDYTENRRIRATGSSSRRLESDDTQTVGLGVDWRKALGSNHLLTWGLDLDKDDVDSARTNVNINTGATTQAVGSFAPGSEYLSSGVFLRDEMFDVGPFDLTAGLRYSYFDFSFDDTANPGQTIDGNFDAFTGSLQAATDVAEGVRVTATLAQAFRAPNLAELARNATFNAGTELSNPDLDPEQSLYEELALDMRREAWSWSLGLYHNSIQDVIGRRLVNDPTPGGPIGDETYQRANTGDVELYGIETRYQRKLGGPDSPYNFGSYLEYTYGVQYDDDIPAFDDQPASRIPPFHGNVSLGWEPAQAVNNVGWLQLSMWFATSQNRLSPQDQGDPRIDKNGTNGWVRFDLDLGGPVGEATSGATWHFGAHNLFDEEYRVHGSGIDGPGFGVVAGLRMTL
jgi:outer membrane receptor protein involved in Fe transport